MHIPLYDMTFLPPCAVPEEDRLGSAGSADELTLIQNGEKTVLTPQEAEAVRRVLEVMKSGYAVNCSCVGLKITPAQTADLLGFSRTVFERFLELGRFPFEHDDSELRLFKLVDVLEYQAKDRAESRAATKMLMEIDEKIGSRQKDLEFFGQD